MEVLLILFVILIWYMLYRFVSNLGYDNKNSVSNISGYRQIFESEQQKKERVKDTKGYAYYRITGMIHHGITSDDLGVHPAIAVAEKDNKYSNHAVAIYRYDIMKKVGYVPDSDSEELFRFIIHNCSNKQTPAIYVLHSGEENFHGCVFVKDFIEI